MYTIHYLDKVIDDIKKIDKTVLSIIKKTIEKKLSLEPLKFGKPLRNTLKNLYSLRIGKYRIIYEVKKDKLVILVIMIASRDTVYIDTLKRIKDN
jgi:mRNA interferase RelE/StbE